MPKGTVKWFNNTMKFGFILGEDGQEVFVHFSEILTEGYKTLKHGDPVQFETEATPKGVKAVRVTKLPEEKKLKAVKKQDDRLRRSA